MSDLTGPQVEPDRTKLAPGQVEKPLGPPEELELSLRVRVPGFVLEIDARCDAFPLLVLGPSGSGKTTLLEAIAGLLPATEGRIAWRGETWLSTSLDRSPGTSLDSSLPTSAQHRVPARERRLGLVSQLPSLFPHLTVAENVAYARRYGGVRGTLEDESAWMEALGIADVADRRAGLVSGGETQRVALARALAAKPSLLLLDEPFAHLDPPARAASQRVLAQAIERHPVPVIQVSHDRGLTALRPRTVWLLWGGRLVAAGPPEGIAAGAPEVAHRAFLTAFLEA